MCGVQLKSVLFSCVKKNLKSESPIVSIRLGGGNGLVRAAVSCQTTFRV